MRHHPRPDLRSARTGLYLGRKLLLRQLPGRRLRPRLQLSSERRHLFPQRRLLRQRLLGDGWRRRCVPGDQRRRRRWLYSGRQSLRGRNQLLLARLRRPRFGSYHLSTGRWLPPDRGFLSVHQFLLRRWRQPERHGSMQAGCRRLRAMRQRQRLQRRGKYLRRATPHRWRRGNLSGWRPNSD